MLTLGLFFALCTNVSAEVIKSFDAKITVNLDSSVTVTETIVYDSEAVEKHGIFRDITPKNAKGEAMKIQDVSVLDATGAPYQWQQQRNNGDIRLKIGDPNATFTGEKTYVVSYTTTNAVSFLDEYDEIYWNATGNNWPFGIQQVTASVVLPDGATVLQQACYVGVTGSTTRCVPDNSFTASNLSAGEGLTIAVGFPKGIVAVATPTFWEKYIVLIVAILLPLAVFVYCFLRWKKYGKDPKGSAVIIPQYDVPDELTPFEVSVLIYEKFRAKDIAAEIIYLATLGYIKINQSEQKIVGLEYREYTLTLLKKFDELSNPFDRTLLTTIFRDIQIGSVVALKSLQKKFYTNTPTISSLIRESVLLKGYYSYLPKANMQGSRWSFSLIFIVVFYFALIWKTVLGGALITIRFGADTPFTIGANFNNSNAVLVIFLSVCLSIIIFSLFKKLMPAKTIKGITTKEYILGLKQYLQIAEKDRLQFHHAPEKNPKVFEKLLPYAMILGVEETWAKEFEEIYTTPPSWYEGADANSFNPIVFVHAISRFSLATTSSLTSTPSGSGSGGGGSSGGGGGGGGGGSW